MKCGLCVVGAGAAGLMAGVFAGRAGADVVIVERNTTAGRKLLRTGRGRCNLTHEATIAEFVRACKPFGRFLKHSLYAFGPQQIREFFREHGLETKVEPSGCVFSATDRASDVKNVLLEQVKCAGVRFLYGRRVHAIQKQDDGFLLKSDKDSIKSRCVIIATGGVSWPDTGSTGDGYALAASLGHGLIEPNAALVPLITKEKWCKNLQGIGIEQVEIKAKLSGMKIASSVGPMMFTDDGVGGPAVFDLSRQLADHLLDAKTSVELNIDMFVGLNRHDLDQKLIALCNAHPRKRIVGSLREFFPSALCQQLCLMADCADAMGSHLSKDKRDKLLNVMKVLTVNVVSTRPIEEATVTRGGVDTVGIDPTTMQSKLYPGLFFAGEVMNVDGPCGGYNLQIAWSTGALAGQSAAKLPPAGDLHTK